MEKLWVDEFASRTFILGVNLNGLLNQFIALQKADQKRILKEYGDVFEIDPTDLMYTFKDWLNAKVEEDISDILKYKDWESITGDIQEYADSISVKTQEATMTTQFTVFDVLKDQFGDSLEGASLTQKLALMEATAQAMRSDYDLRSALESLDSSDISIEDAEGLQALDFSADLFDFQDVNEGLRVMGFLYEGIIEDYSGLAAEERLTD